MRPSPPSTPSDAGHGPFLLLQPPWVPWMRPRAHSDSGIHLGAALVPVSTRVVNLPPVKRQSIAVPGAPDCKDDWREESCRRNVAELLARHVLDITTATTPPLAAQVAPHAPLLVEDPPSTADEEDDDVLRVAAVAGGPAQAPRFPNDLLNGAGDPPGPPRRTVAEDEARCSAQPQAGLQEEQEDGQQEEEVVFRDKSPRRRRQSASRSKAMSYLAAALGVDRAMRYLSDDSLYSENSNGMRKAVSSFDVFRRASDVSMVVVSTEDVAEAVAAEEKQAAAARAGRERQASVGSNTSRGSNGSAGRVRRRRTVSTRARAGTSGATSAAANKRKSLPLFAMKLFGRKGSSSGEEITMSNLDLDTVNDHGGSSSNETSSTPASPNGDLYASSGNLSSTKSAPATPIGDRLQASASGSAATSTTVRRRPLGAPTVAPSSSTPSLVPLPSPATSKARHKKFHRHFDSVSPDERVLNYYSCALISDILLQGHLYITSNYFAFYSNVFGYVTKVLIPTASVLKVSKEKTARIIPNAVGVATSDEKHVFGSLLSRDNTYKLMVQVWKTALGPPAHSPQPLRAVCAPCRPRAKDLKDEVDSASASGDVLQEDDDSSLSGDAALPPVPLDKIPVVAATKASAVAASTSSALAIASSAHPAGVGLSAGPSLVSQADLNRSSRQTIILGVSTALVAFLLMSTAFLFHRMSRIQDQFRIQTGDNLYQDLARWQNHLHARSAGQVEEFLSTHLDQLAKVRKSLEALTLLIVSNEDDRTQQADVVVHHHSPYRDEKQQTRPPSLAQEEVKNS